MNLVRINERGTTAEVYDAVKQIPEILQLIQRKSRNLSTS